MPNKKAKESSKSNSKRRPAIGKEARENQMIGLAVDLAEQQLRDGTASSQIITHYLKLGTIREDLEKEKLMKENQLIDAKIDNLHATERNIELYQEAIDAMRRYSGNGGDDSKEDDN